MMDNVDVGMESGSSSPGNAVSGRVQNQPIEDEDEDDDLYYIPPRRASLDLGSSPMDTSYLYFGQVLSPALSYTSMTSGDNLGDCDGSPTRVQMNREDSFSSCYSYASDDCEKIIPKPKSKEDTTSERFEYPELIHDPDLIRHPSLTVPFTFKAISETLGKLSEGEIQKFKILLWKRYPKSFSASPQGMDIVDLVDRLLECYTLEVSLQITKTLLEIIGRKRMIDFLQTLCIRNEVRHDLRETLKRIYGEVCEVTMQEDKRPFDDVYTNLLITSTCDNGPNIEHEVLTIEKLDSNKEEGRPLSTKDFLNPEKLEHSNLKLMLITGVAGSGKSMVVRRLIMDWTEGRSHQHVSFLFPLPFRDLKQFEDTNVSLLEIIQKLYPETQKLRDEDYRSEDCKIMFIFDGLDEYNGPLDFQNTTLLGDHADSTTLNVIVVNLLRARLLYRGMFLVFSRPQVRRCIPWDTHCEEIEVRGFLDPDKDEYFKRRFKEPDQSAQVIAYINSSRTLCIMCHLPLFCSLIANEFQHLFSRDQSTQADLPRSITYMYTKLLLELTRRHRIFRATHQSPDEERDFLMKLGKLAFDMLEHGRYKITKSDWKGVGIDSEEAVVNSGLCTQYNTNVSMFSQEKVLSFIHPTMQEYLAALYVYLSFRNQGINISEQHLKKKLKGMFKSQTVMELYKNAVDKSLLCEDGKLDIYLRFLLGTALQTNRELLQPFCTSSVKWPTVIEDAAALIRKRIRENQYPGRNSNLQCCLEELGVLASEAGSSRSDTFKH